MSEWHPYNTAVHNTGELIATNWKYGCTVSTLQTKIHIVIANAHILRPYNTSQFCLQSVLHF